MYNYHHFWSLGVPNIQLGTQRFAFFMNFLWRPKVWFVLLVFTGILELPVSETCSDGFLKLKMPSKASRLAGPGVWVLQMYNCHHFGAWVLQMYNLHHFGAWMLQLYNCLGRRPHDGNSFACVFANFRVEVERQPAVETKNATTSLVAPCNAPTDTNSNQALHT